MSNLTLIFICMAFYLCGMLFIGWMGRKYSGDFKSFMNAAKSGTIWMVAGSCVGSQIGNGVVVGGAEYGAMYGIGGVWYGIGGSLALAVFGLIMALHLYNKSEITISAVLNNRYGGEITGVFYALANCFAAISIMAGQIVAGKRLFEYFGINGTIGAVAMCLVVLVYSSMSGQWGVMMTDVLQVGVILVTTFIVFVDIIGQGAFPFMESVLPASYYTPIPFEMDTFVMMLFPACLFGFVSSANYQRLMSSNNTTTARWAPVIGCIVSAPYAILPVFIGMYGRALYPDAAAGTIVFKVLMEKCNPFVGAIFICAVLAAVMSTVDTQLIYVTGSMTNDIYKRLFNKNASDKLMAKMVKIITIVLGLIIVYMALGASNIIAMMSSAYTIMCAGSLVMFVGGLFWKKATKAGAVASAVAGIATVFIGKMGVTLPYASVFPLLPSFIAFVAVSLATQPKNETV